LLRVERPPSAYLRLVATIRTMKATN